ncbi:RluA family pseudouridine synthase [Acuticoccus sp.]|uniref:RluA family pseudouridine synthase n=1 Tax=Acuticoccus sp. TaxID=1904378 RepID=UPI003B52206A
MTDGTLSPDGSADDGRVYGERLSLAIDDGGRADTAIAAASGLSRTRVQALIRSGAAQLNGAPLVDPSMRLAPGAAVVLEVPAPEPATPLPQAIPLDILHEDAAVVVLVKSAGLVVHPAAGHASGTLVNALIAHCAGSLSGIGGVSRPGIVHRLDKDTSGVMVVAKTDAAHGSLAAQFADHGRTGPLRRRYEALAWGTPAPPDGTIDRPIGRHPSDRQRFAVRDGGKRSITHYRTRARLGPATHLSLELETGRTHQIRVHLASVGTPLLGDPLYGAGFATKANRLAAGARELLAALDRQALHAAHLSFAHPTTGRTMSFEAPLPTDLAALVDSLRATA